VKKIVKESLFEKFKEDTDPISDMGIGAVNRKKFKSEKDLLDNIVLILPAILQVNDTEGVKEYLSNILWDKGDILPEELYTIIVEWIKANTPFIISNGKNYKTIQNFTIDWPGSKIYFKDNTYTPSWPFYVLYSLYKQNLIPESKLEYVLDTLNNTRDILVFYDK
jgi:hypothetical protein